MSDRTVTIRDSIRINAPFGRVFALSTSIPVVQRELRFTPVEGLTSGHVNLGSKVLWKGWLFALPQRHLTLITAFRPPYRGSSGLLRAFFQDTQESGRFHSFQHDHHLTAESGGAILLQDEIRFSLPLGPSGYLLARLLIEPFIRKTLHARLRLIRQLATTQEWKSYVDPSAETGEAEQLFPAEPSPATGDFPPPPSGPE